MVIVLGTYKQENFSRPEKTLEKTREIDNEARISKRAKMKRKFKRNQKDSEPRYTRTRTRGFFSTVRVVSFTTCTLSINFFKHLLIKSSG